MREESNLVGCLLYTAGLEDADTELALEVRGQSMMRGTGRHGRGRVGPLHLISDLRDVSMSTDVLPFHRSLRVVAFRYISVLNLNKGQKIPGFFFWGNLSALLRPHYPHFGKIP